MLSLLQNLFGGIQSVGFWTAFGIHQECGIPATGCIQYEPAEPLIGGRFLRVMGDQWLSGGEWR